MTTTFKLPEDIRFSEELGLHLVFQEVRIRGSDEVFCRVAVSEVSSLQTYEVQDTYDFESWELMKQEYPTLLDFLEELSCNELWNASWREDDRIFFIESLTGHEGLYEATETVWFDAQDSE